MPLKKLKIKSNALPKILKVDPTMTSTELIEKEVHEAFDLATQMLGKAATLLESIIAKEKESMILYCWRRQHLILHYFGDYDLSVRQIKKVERRIKRAYRRVSKQNMKIRIAYKPKYENAYAVNSGFMLSPRSFMLLPNWFKKDKQGKAGTIIHELFHDLFRDQKVEYFGRKVKVYSSAAANKLAKQKPKKARRSAENYEQFCEALWREETIV